MSDFTVYNNMPRIMPTPAAVPAASPATSPAAASGAEGGGFGGMLKDAIQQVDSVQQSSSGEMQSYLNNSDDTDLHSVMIALEKADLSFQMMMQVRNKIVTAYQDIMKTAV